MGIKQSSSHPLLFRVLHEIIITSIVALAISGAYIHFPFIYGLGFMMTLARGVHTAFAGILILATVIRIILMFFGPLKDWRNFIPSWSDLKDLPSVINYYAYMKKEYKQKKQYNPLQMITYTLAFILIIFQIFSGIALKWPHGVFRWLNYNLFQNEVETRMAHYVVMAMFVMFLMIHVYLVIREKFHVIDEMHLLSRDEDKKKGILDTGNKE